MLRVLLAFVFAAVVVFTAACQGDGESASSDMIAFASKRDGNFEIYVMNGDGSNPRRLTNNDAPDALPSWSPDGTKIAFTSFRDGNFEIHVMNLDGSDQTKLADNANSPAWSPDGSLITFASQGAIHVMDSDGSNVRNLTNDFGSDDSPDWSPDGTKIAFTSFRDGDWEIYVMNSDGSNQIRLTDHAPYADGAPSWSPDSREIAFNAATRGVRRDILVMNADGSATRELTGELNGGLNLSPSWSPDGSKIAFSSQADTAETNDIFVIDADGSNIVNLTDDPEHDDRDPAWSPLP